MKIRELSLLLLGILSASIVIAAEKLKKDAAGDIPTVITSSSKPVVKPWIPLAFNSTIDRLPPNYRGLDPVQFIKLFKSKVGRLKKGEFETSEEFGHRIANADAILSPINTIDEYAFRISGIYTKYDADKQAYLISQDDYLCHDTYRLEESKDLITCIVSAFKREKSTYVGSNAFGSSRIVERIRGSDFSLAIPKVNALRRPVFIQTAFAYKFDDSLPVSLEKARHLKNMEIAALFVGRITAAKIIEGRGKMEKPTIESPDDIFITEDAVPFELNRIIYYVVKTGEILGQIIY